MKYMVALRWPKGVACPTCGSARVSFLAKQQRWQCSSHHAKRQFTLKTGTIFEDSPLGLDKWLPCVWLITNAKDGISSYEIARALGITQKTAWFMLHRVRLAHQGSDGGKLGGEVEVDETLIGGKARNMQSGVRLRRVTGTGGKDKTAVIGIVKRGGKIRSSVVPNRKKNALQAEMRKHVEPGSVLYTDALPSYGGLVDEYNHQVINHATCYAGGNIHTNTLENFGSLLKRGIRGTYISVEPFHLFRYLDEQAFRHNYRENMNDSDRFSLALSQIVGKRLTYAELIGKVEQTSLN